MRWDPEKSTRLKRERGISFEEIIQAELVCVLKHAKRADQKMLLFRLRGYIWGVPFVSCGNEIFLKTLFPSRKYTKKLKKEVSDEKNKIE